MNKFSFDCLDKAIDEINEANSSEKFCFREADSKLYDKVVRERMRVKEWTFRCIYESMAHISNCVLTLTYNDDNLPLGGELCKRDYQLFLKSLRESIYPQKVRYFGCGEYGKKHGRPHYHFILFGWCPEDLEYFFTDDNGVKYYKSKTVRNLWKRGNILVCRELSPRTIPYVCKYLQKFVDYAEKGVKPFLSMSLKPGIGYNFRNTNLCDIERDLMYANGKRMRLARYYMKVLEREDFTSFSNVSFRRNCGFAIKRYVPGDESKYLSTLKKFKKFVNMS